MTSLEVMRGDLIPAIRLPRMGFKPALLVDQLDSLLTELSKSLFMKEGAIFKLSLTTYTPLSGT